MQLQMISLSNFLTDSDLSRNGVDCIRVYGDTALIESTRIYWEQKIYKNMYMYRYA